MRERVTFSNSSGTTVPNLISSQIAPRSNRESQKWGKLTVRLVKSLSSRYKCIKVRGKSREEKISEFVDLWGAHLLKQWTLTPRKNSALK